VGTENTRDENTSLHDFEDVELQLTSTLLQPQLVENEQPLGIHQKSHQSFSDLSILTIDDVLSCGGCRLLQTKLTS
jgi:hypothetical protein